MTVGICRLPKRTTAFASGFLYCHTVTALTIRALYLFIKAAWQGINLEALLDCLLKSNKTALSTYNMDANGNECPSQLFRFTKFLSQGASSR